MEGIEVNGEEYIPVRCSLCEQIKGYSEREISSDFWCNECTTWQKSIEKQSMKK